MGKIKLLLYCTKGNKQKDLLWSNNLKTFFLDGKYNRLIDDLPKYLLNGKIVAECDFYTSKIWYGVNEKNEYINFIKVCDDACLTLDEIDNYLKGQNGYVIHIKNLNIFDKPRELSEYVNYWDKPIKKAPQNMMYAYGRNTGDKYILISIKAEWLCKILNGEKTMEVRKKVLKEMINNA